MHSTLPRAAAVLLSLTGLAAPTLAADDAAPPKFIPTPGVLEFSGQLIVRPLQSSAWKAAGLDDATITLKRQSAAAALAANTITYYPEVDEYVVAIPGGAGLDENTYSQQLMATGLYQYAEPNWIAFPIATPNDPLFPQQWHHAMMHCEEAWNTTTGSQSIIVAVTDTGIDVNHPDLIANRVPGYHAPSNTPEALGGPIEDINGHGTHVAGCAAAVGNNALGVAGVAFNCKVMMCRVTDSPGGGAAISELLEAARWAIDNGARSASTSYSGVSSATIQTTGAYIRSKNGVYLYAAGNEGANWSNFDYPDVIVVGATHPGDDRTGWSGHGKAVDVFAPGEGILATVVGGGYEAWSGTSMATPVANGLVGLLFSFDPNFSTKQIDTFLFHGCKDLGPIGEDEIYGWGRIDAKGSIDLAKLSKSPQPPAAVDDNAETFTNVWASLDVLANDYDLNDDTLVIDQFQSQTQQGGTVERLVGTGPGGRDELLYKPTPGFAGTDAFVYTIKDATGLEGVGTVFITVDDPSTFREPENPANPKSGIWVSYYELAAPVKLPDYSSLTPYQTEVDNAINYNSTEGNFSTSGRANEVGAVYEGFVSVPAANKWTFYTSSDDGSKLWIGDTLVVSNDFEHGMVEQSGIIKLKPGKHKIRVEFFENQGGAGLLVSMSSSTYTKKVVPSFNWFHIDAPPPACYPDCDLSGELSIDDFICFQTLFALADPAADCDADGALSIDDFICFQTLFALGC